MRLPRWHGHGGGGRSIGEERVHHCETYLQLGQSTNISMNLFKSSNILEVSCAPLTTALSVSLSYLEMEPSSNPKNLVGSARACADNITHRTEESGIRAGDERCAITKHIRARHLRTIGIHIQRFGYFRNVGQHGFDPIPAPLDLGLNARHLVPKAGIVLVTPDIDRHGWLWKGYVFFGRK